MSLRFAWRWLGPVVLAMGLVPLLACGKECEICESDEDCKSEEGLVCAPFEDGTKRCGSGVGATSCRVP